MSEEANKDVTDLLAFALMLSGGDKQRAHTLVNFASVVACACSILGASDQAGESKKIAGRFQRNVLSMVRSIQNRAAKCDSAGEQTR